MPRLPVVVSEAVRRMFADIAPAYDRTNAVLSFGVHGRWRRRAVAASGARGGSRVLDCASGTGDLAFDFAGAVGSDGAVVATDFCAPMLVRGREKALERSDARLFDFGLADATELPVKDASFDVASIAFGIRNVDDPRKGLRELARAVRPGGRVVILEFGQPHGVMRTPFTLYSRHVIPRVGGLLTGNREAYEYLPRTSAEFPAGEAFLAMMREVGVFSEVKAIPLTGGIAYIYVGVVS